MKTKIIVRRPNECSEKELDAFVTVAAMGEEVVRQHIERGADRAAALLWIEENGSPFAVCALKTPRKSYRDGVFQKAAVPAECGRFPLELGYIFVEQAQRGQGYAPALVQKAMTLYGREGIYATTRADNTRMQEILKESGFSSAGSTYPSERHARRLLMLFVRAAAS